MRLLVLGGTVFLGRHVVEEALLRGHDVTLFNRGRTAPELFSNVPNIERLRGDRDGDLSALESRTWDAAVDTSGFVPRVVRASAELLASAVPHYTFVSSGSVYSDTSTPGLDEQAAVEALVDESSEDVGRHYGALKASCERVVDEEMSGRVLIVRAGLIVGPHDPTGRFTYWVHRIARGGEVLAPEPRDQPVQFIDARDLASWILDMAEARRTGTFNATGPEKPITMERLLEEMVSILGRDGRLVWVDDSFLHERGVREWSDLPLWLATRTHPEYAGFLAVNVDRATAAGLRCRPLAQTVRDTLEEAAPTAGAGLDPSRERELLAAWLS